MVRLVRYRRRASPTRPPVTCGLHLDLVAEVGFWPGRCSRESRRGGDTLSAVQQPQRQPRPRWCRSPALTATLAGKPVLAEVRGLHAARRGFVLAGGSCRPRHLASVVAVAVMASEDELALRQSALASLVRSGDGNDVVVLRLRLELWETAVRHRAPRASSAWCPDGTLKPHAERSATSLPVRRPCSRPSGRFTGGRRPAAHRAEFRRRPPAAARPLLPRLRRALETR